MLRDLVKNFYYWIKNNKFNIYIAIIFIIALSMRVYAINNKTTIFWDDTASYISSTLNNNLEDNSKFKVNWNKIETKYEHNYTAYELKKALFESKSDIKSIWNDVKTLHNKTIDHQHPNLYYTILRIWSSGMDYSDSKAMIVRGCSLNLLFFTLSFFFMYKLLNLIKPNKTFIAMGLFFAFVLTGSISNTLLIRPYPMTECFFILTMYQFLKIHEYIDKGEIISLKKCVLYSIGFALFFLSYYYSIIIMAFIALEITIKCVKTKNLIFLKYFYLIIAIALLITYIFCPLYFYNLTVSEHIGVTRGHGALWNFMYFSNNGIWLIELLNKYIFYDIGFYLIIFGLALIGIPVLKEQQEKQNWKQLVLVCGTTLLFAYLISVMCPFQEYAAARYVLFLFPIISILLTAITFMLKKEIIISLTIIIFISSFLPIYKYLEDNTTANYLGTITYYRDFDFLNINSILYKNDANKPLPLVVYNKNNGLWFNYIFYLPNETIVRFEEYNFHKKNTIFNEYISLNAGERKENDKRFKAAKHIKNKKETK